MRKRNDFLSYGKQTITDEDIEEVVNVLKSPNLTQGPKIKEFEDSIAKYTESKYAVAFSNGTAALHGACFAAGISQGDEVITSPLTFVASSNAILYCGGTPVFADINKVTYNIDPKSIEKRITSKTKAIIAVDFSGQPADLDGIKKIANKYNLVLIEDGAHSLGAEYNGTKVGGLVDMTMFSFHPIKPITSGEGGVIVTNSETLYEKLLSFRNHGIVKSEYSLEQGPWYYEMKELGFNYRMTDLQAALGNSQLKKIDRFISKRREIAMLYDELLKDLNDILITPTQINNSNSGWHLYVIRIKKEILSNKTRKVIFEDLRNLNIGVHVHYIPVYWQPYYQKLGYERGLCPVAEEVYESILTLPIFPAMTIDDIKDVVSAVKYVLK